MKRDWEKLAVLGAVAWGLLATFAVLVLMILGEWVVAEIALGISFAVPLLVAAIVAAKRFIDELCVAWRGGRE